MDLTYVKKLVKLLASSGIDEIEIEEDGKRIRVAKNTNSIASVSHPQGASFVSAPVSAPAAAPSVTPSLPSASPPAALEAKTTLHEIRSPIVGTFYRSPAPDADPYVQVGQAVQQNTVLCIIEAMKLMNEIESDVAGRIAKIHVENGQPVEYNQVLFSIEPI
jgi:acetyl-CoA carboxylase biotin carboxyl carrier protein